MSEVPYRLACVCGHLLAGMRRESYQVIRCPSCNAERFILPRSALPPPGGHLPSTPAVSPRGRVWLYPVLAGGLTLLLVAGGFAVYRIYFAGDVENHSEAPLAASLMERLQTAQANLALGKFRLAEQQLGSAEEARGLPPNMRRRWVQAYREAALLADLSGEPLEDILGHAMSMPAAEWQADFAHRYRGQAVLFDMQLSRAADGRLQSSYRLFAGAEPARLELSNLSLFRKWKLTEPQRAIFAARLSSVALEPPGPAWVVRFQPDRASLMTSREAVGRCAPPLAEPDAARIFERQAKLVFEKEP